MDNQGLQQYSFTPYPELMTQDELIRYLRIPEVSKAENFANVVKNLADAHDLPCIHISRQPLYPLADIRDWVRDKAKKELGMRG